MRCCCCDMRIVQLIYRLIIFEWKRPFLFFQTSLFYLHPGRNLPLLKEFCYPLVAVVYAVVILIRFVRLWEVQGHLLSLRLSGFCEIWSFSCPFFKWNNFFLISGCLKYVKLAEYKQKCVYWGACGVMVIVLGNGHGDTSSNPRRDWLHFT